jgi:hypothetical protein
MKNGGISKVNAKDFVPHMNLAYLEYGRSY